MPGGTGWYRKNFTLPSDYAGKSIVLNFDGSYNHTYVYVNGTKVGENHYGYNDFAFDISKHLICDGKTENVISVKWHIRHHPVVGILDLVFIVM